MTVWDLYFCQIVGMNQHPGNNRENAEKLTLKQCADLADKMVKIRSERLCQ